MRILSFLSGLAVLFSSLALLHIVHYYADHALASDHTPAFWIKIVVILIIDVFSLIGGICCCAARDSPALMEDGANPMNTASRARVAVQQVVPFFAVTNIETSVRYYVDGLGFSVPKKWVVDGKLRWCWLELGGAALMLQEFLREGGNAWVPSCKVGEGVSLNFICDDAIAFYHAVKSRGIEASEPQVGNSMWVTSLKDPDGYKLFFASKTDVSEDTKLSEWKG